MHDQDIPRKTGRVLNFILLFLLLILIRSWYLAVILHEPEQAKALKPTRRLVLEPALRATIEDRFGLPLAVNKIQYNAAICYAHMREIPSIRWKKGPSGKMVRVQERKEHIEKLSSLLGKELQMDPINIEDTIHGKASLFPHTPFVIKEEISEEEYFRLKALEKDYPGLQTQRLTKRFYPQGKIGADVIGYLGSITQEKYEKIASEIGILQDYLSSRERNENPFLPLGFRDPLEVRDRLAELQEKAYTINDLVGKTGVEAAYEEELRGSFGKAVFEVDVKGNFLRKLPLSKAPLSGKKLILSLSAELQDYAEKLLSANEAPSEDKDKLDETWIRGGAIVAMIPQTGEIVALASYPRFDPNEFIPSKDPLVRREKEDSVHLFLEDKEYIGALWDGTSLLEKEYFSFLKGHYEKTHFSLTWNSFLETILPSNTALKTAMTRINTVKMAEEIQRIGTSHPLLTEIMAPQDRLLAVDLCGLALDPLLFPQELFEKIKEQSLNQYSAFRQSSFRLQKEIKVEIQELFHDFDFLNWRSLYFKNYLKQKRAEEKKEKKYNRPYTDYLDQAEKNLFHAFWDAYKPIFLYTALTGVSPVSLEEYPQLQIYLAYLKAVALEETDDPQHKQLKKTLLALSPQEGVAYLKTFRSFHDLCLPLKGTYPRLRKKNETLLQKHLAASFYPQGGYGFTRSLSFRQTHAPGSVFKLVTAYQALWEKIQTMKESEAQNLNPLTLIDEIRGLRSNTSAKQVIGYTLDGKPIARLYKGGMLPRSSHGGMGKVDLIGALEQSSNLYFSILAGDYIESPENLAEAARLFGFGEKTGIDLPGEAKGALPRDLSQNRTGLYSFAIGQHAFTTTPLQTAVMTSTIANQGLVVRPKVVQALVGEESAYQEEELFSAPTYPFEKSLALIGIHFPLFTATLPPLQNPHVKHPPTEVKRKLAFPDHLFRLLTTGMRQTVMGARGTARPAIMRSLYDHPTAVNDYYNIHGDLLVKTGTPQIHYKQTIDTETKAEIRTNIYFSAIAYPTEKRNAPDRLESPELVVTVFLRFKQAGRDGGPMAAQIVKKWRELVKKHESDNAR